MVVARTRRTLVIGGGRILLSALAGDRLHNESPGFDPLRRIVRRLPNLARHFCRKRGEFKSNLRAHMVLTRWFVRRGRPGHLGQVRTFY
jgi:hypothetical protein